MMQEFLRYCFGIISNRKGQAELWEIIAFVILAVVFGAFVMLIFLKGFKLV